MIKNIKGMIGVSMFLTPKSLHTQNNVSHLRFTPELGSRRLRTKGPHYQVVDGHGSTYSVSTESVSKR